MEILAEPVVSIVVERLGDFLIEEGKFLYGVSGQVEGIQAELRRMQSFLKDADARQDESESVHNWVVEIRELANESEDVIEFFVFRVAFRRRNILKRYACIFSEGIARHKVGSKIEVVKSKISELTRSLQTYGLRAITEGEGSSSAYQRQLQLRRSYSHVVEDDFVGLEGDVEKLVAHLVDEDKDSYYRLVSIGGMGGLGKTTLAQKVYDHKKVKRHFDGFAWSCISQQLQKKDVLQGILIKLTPEKRKNIIKMRDEELVKELFQVQRDKKCLVVLDDIWSREAWDSLRHAFPTKETGSKILLTTRNIEVATHVDPKGFLYEPRFLNDDESWELLQKKGFITRDHTDTTNDKSMEELGRKMVKRCGGLPLAVIVLGGILVTKHRLREWEMVYRSIDSYLSKGKGIEGQQHEHGGVSQVLALSYSNLPYQLKQCFLYLGNFKEYSNIEVEKLCQMWIAEGLVSSHDRVGEEETMTDVAERYLAELVQRYMVQVQVEESTGIFKSCRLHDLMRDLCLSKGEEENFLKVIDFRSSHGVSSSSSPSPSISKTGRLSIYLDAHDDVDGYVLPVLPKQDSISTQHIRSLSLRGLFPRKMIRTYFKDFRLLRVLNLDGLKLMCLPKVVGNLILLRYLSLRRSEFKKLPSSICNLEYLQTLDLRNTNDLVIPNVLWKMGRLTHLYLPTVVNSNKRKLRLDGLSNLETLVYFDSDTCDVKDLFMLTNLRKLTAHTATKPEYLTAMVKYLRADSTTGNRLQRSSITVCDYEFCSEEELTVLRQLLGCHHLNKLYMYGFIKELPECRDFSPSLNELILSNSELKEDPMATLEQLPNLWSLKLYFDAFVGKEMVCSTKGFPRLKSLSLSKLNNLEKWRVDEGAMPNLSSLHIAICDNLEKVPDGLEFVFTLQELKIWGMPEAFENRVRVIDGEKGADFDKVRHVPSITFGQTFAWTK